MALIQERFVEIAIVEVATYPGEDTGLYIGGLLLRHLWAIFLSN